jgi:hypothetical protein
MMRHVSPAGSLSIVAFSLLFLASGCGSEGASGSPLDPGRDAGDGADAESPADARGVDDCPDPRVPGVHYESDDISKCPAAQDFGCQEDQNGFYNACGCGCIDKGTNTCSPEPDPRLHFVSRDPATCVSESLHCSVLQQPFSNACGCGCIDP